jgi:hypothetical protein
MIRYLEFCLLNCITTVNIDRRFNFVSFKLRVCNKTQMIMNYLQESACCSTKRYLFRLIKSN